MPKTPTPKPVTAGVVAAHECLTAAAFCTRLGITSGQFEQMRRNGLRVHIDVGKKLRIIGSDFLYYVERLPLSELGDKPAPVKRGRPPGGRAKQLKAEGAVMKPGESLTLKAFQARMGVSWAAVRRMIDRGLKVRLDGKYRRVLADDFAAYLATLPAVEPRKPGSAQ